MEHDEHLAHHDAQIALLTSLLERQQDLQKSVLQLMGDMSARITQNETRITQNEAMLQRLIDIQRHRNGS
jgi:UDP-2,3-diacylglucosamine pyrophosphatase LpxH